MVDVTKHTRPSLQRTHVRDYIRRHRVLMLVVGVPVVVCLIMIIVQLTYGAQARALPFMAVDGHSVAGDDAATIERDIRARYGHATLQIAVRDRKLDTTLRAAGLTPDVNTLVGQVVTYPLWQRFIPFTLFKGVGANYPVHAQLDSERFAEFIKTITPLCAVEPVDATVAVVDGALRLTPAQAGAKCSAVSIRSQFSGMALTASRNSRRVAVSVVEPAVSTESARQLLAQAQVLIDRKLTLKLIDAIHRPDKATIASWIIFETDPTTKRPTVSVSDDEVATYLRSLQGSIYIAPGATVVSLFDGKEVGRSIGHMGRGVDLDDGVSRIKKQLLAGDGPVDLTLAVLKPVLQYNRTYSRTNAGLQSLLSYIVAQKGDFAISVRQLDGAGLTANANGSKVYTPASTYKLFVAYAVLKRIESGQMAWGDQATNGRTVAACFDTMIIHSDNPCAEWFGQTIGWRTITDMLRAVGLSGATSLNTPRGFEATANDEVAFLAKLQTGRLLSATSTKRLLDVMKRQIYRSGIPAGAGVPVADKVGFLNGLLHDAAIVYAPSGTYVVVIMTNGSSWSQIADAARQINNWLK